jgi:two-component system nitrate/nitrite response regulator NarL
LIVLDDQPLFRKGISDLLSQHAQLKVIGNANARQEGINLIRSLRPNLVLLSLNMRSNPSFESIKAIKDINEQTLVVALADSDDEEDACAVLQAGADGYLLREIEPVELVHRLVGAVPGNFILSDSIRNCLRRALNGGRTTVGRPETVALTAREKEVLGLLGAGLCNKLIGRRLDIVDWIFLKAPSRCMSSIC